MKTTSKLKKLSIHELKENYKTKATTPEALIREIALRAEGDQDYNIWITPPSIDRIQPYLDQLNSMDPEQTPLWGIPFAIKDNIDLAGVPTTAGCKEFAYIPEKHAAVVQRLIDAGAIPVGKTNLDQFATGLVGTRSPYGETKNALNPELISGGSSSGSAVAVARGLAAFSLGTDTAGSGRVPAALNRLVGFKPSLGAWPLTGVVPACASLDCVTVFATTLDDTLLIDNVARGFDISDPWSQPVKRRSGQLPSKILLPKETPAFYGPFAAEYKTAWEASIGQLKNFQLPVEYIDTRYLADAAAVLYDGPWVAERWAGLGEFISKYEGAAFPVTEKILRSGKKPEYDAASVFQAMHKLQAYKQAAHQQFQDAVLIMPTSGGTWRRDEVRQDPIQTNSKMGLYTNHCNLLDLCAIAIPGIEAAENLPFGISLFSSGENEHLIAGLSDLILNGRFAPATSSTTLVAVCGLHMRGFPLEKQMREHGADFVRKARTAPLYKMIKLPSSPPKPGLVRTNESGVSIELELWKMPLNELGHFISLIPAPLGLGKVQLEDGSEVTGFICEAAASDTGEDISHIGSWRNLV